MNVFRPEVRLICAMACPLGILGCSRPERMACGSGGHPQALNSTASNRVGWNHLPPVELSKLVPRFRKS